MPLSISLAQLLLLASLHAQVLSLAGPPTPPVSGVGINLNVLKPALDANAFGLQFTALTTISHLELRWPEGDAVLHADLPLVHLGVSGGGSSNLIGNLGVGFRSRRDTGLVAGFELLVPTFLGGGDDDGAAASFVGVVGDYQGFESYLKNVISARGLLGYRAREGNGPIISAVVRPVLLKPKSGPPELLADLGVGADYGQAWWTAGIAVSTRYAVTASASYALFGDFVTEVDLGFRGTFAAFQPSVYVRVPLDGDLRKELGPSLGIGVSYGFGP